VVELGKNSSVRPGRGATRRLSLPFRREAPLPGTPKALEALLFLAGAVAGSALVASLIHGLLDRPVFPFVVVALRRERSSLWR